MKSIVKRESAIAAGSSAAFGRETKPIERRSRCDSRTVYSSTIAPIKLRCSLTVGHVSKHEATLTQSDGATFPFTWDDRCRSRYGVNWRIVQCERPHNHVGMHMASLDEIYPGENQRATWPTSQQIPEDDDE